MSCSARLPVYTLVIAAFLPERPLLGPLVGARAAAILGLYLLGFLAAFGTARLLRSSLLKSDQTPVVLDMPPCRWPTLRSLALRLLEASKVFLRRAGTVILGVSVLWWLLAHWPLKDGQPPPIGESLAGKAGHALEPLIRPLGFNWQIGVGLISSLVSREAIIGTLGTIHAMDPDARALGLQAALRKDLDAAGAAALLVFFALMMPCVSTLAMVRRETGSWKWPLAQFAYMGALAYAGGFLVNRLVRLLA
jgi:ferrous iron transport protein B